MKIFRSRISIIRALFIAAAIMLAIAAYTGYAYKGVVTIILPESGKVSNDQQQRIIPATEFKIIKSSQTVERAMHKVFNLRNTYEVSLKSAIIDDIKYGLSYTFDAETRIFDLTYSDRSSEYVSKIVNAVAESYIENYISNIQSFSSNALQNLYMQQTEYKKALTEANSKYEKFCNAEKIFNIDNELSILSNQLSQYNNELNRVNADASLLERNPNAFRETDRPSADLSAYEDNEIGRELNKKINESEIRLAMLKRKYTEAHPIVKNEIMTLDVLKKQLAIKSSLPAEPPKKIEKKYTPAETAGNKAGSALDLLNLKKSTYQKLIAECQEAIKSYPRKKSMLRSYEVEISKIENILTRINKQIEDLMIFQQTKVIDNVPRIIEYCRKPKLHIPYSQTVASIVFILLFAASFDIEKRLKAIMESKNRSRYVKMVSDEMNIKVIGHLTKTEIMNFEDAEFSAKCFVYHQKDSKPAKSFNSIRNGLEVQLADANTKTFGVTSLNAGEGKTIFTANLGLSTAQFGQNTLVIDFNYKTTDEPVSSLYKADRSFGMTDIIMGETPYQEVMCNTAMDNLKIIPAGTLPPNVQRIFSSELCQSLLNDTAAAFDLVMIDCPAFNVSSDFHAISRYLKHIILMIDIDKIKNGEEFREEMKIFGEFVENNHLDLLGVIFNEK
ncbi:MAG TPA: polysaccharide biosynthesis tyrosine autokinase [Candidatus Wallbacteria bacterium]|mgnify:CR=1 FL=1|nr:polysaccharide biosynthesis tyrosine autokinase [Candidatus Wallbacteria bacterium]